MKYRNLFVVGGAFIAVTAIAPVAQGGSMGNGSQQRNAAAAKKCLAMPHDEMMKDQGCKSQMVLHPESFPGGVPPKN